MSMLRGSLYRANRLQSMLDELNTMVGAADGEEREAIVKALLAVRQAAIAAKNEGTKEKKP